MGYQKSNPYRRASRKPAPVRIRKPAVLRALDAFFDTVTRILGVATILGFLAVPALRLGGQTELAALVAAAATPSLLTLTALILATSAMTASKKLASRYLPEGPRRKKAASGKLEVTVSREPSKESSEASAMVPSQDNFQVPSGVPEESLSVADLL